MARYRLSTTAQADLIDILAWTQGQFGEAARKRYETLLVTALRDISSQPDRAGSVERPELGDGVRPWHLHRRPGRFRCRYRRHTSGRFTSGYSRSSVPADGLLWVIHRPSGSDHACVSSTTKDETDQERH